MNDRSRCSSAEETNSVGHFRFASDPIFFPILAAAGGDSRLGPVVFYFSDHSIRGAMDPGFGVPVAWDVPLTEGYEYRFISRDADLLRFNSVSAPHVKQLLREGQFEAVFLHGYMFRYCRQVVRAARSLGIGTVLRGDFCDVVPFGGRSPTKALMRNLYLHGFISTSTPIAVAARRRGEHLINRGISTDRMYFTPYAVDTALFEQQRGQFTRETVRTELGIPNDRFVILYSGKMIPQTPLLLMQALSQLPEISKVMVLMVGDGPMRGSGESRPGAAGRPADDGRICESEPDRQILCCRRFVRAAFAT